MPISEKLKNDINHLEIDNALKQVMQQILELEDLGGRQYKRAYEQLIDRYIEEKERNENGSSN